MYTICSPRSVPRTRPRERECHIPDKKMIGYSPYPERLFSVVPMYSTIAAALLTQQVLTQTPCYAALVGLCSDPPKHTVIVIPAPQIDGSMPIQLEETPNVTDTSLRPRYRVHP